MSSPEEWFRAQPPITRTWLAVAFLTTVLVSTGYLSAYTLAFIPSKLLEGEVWRLVTPFIYVGEFGFPFVMNLFFLVRYSGAYEASPYAMTGPGVVQGCTADYVLALLVNSLILLCIALYMGLYFMGSSLVFSVLYLWSKKNADVPVSFWGFAFKGAHLPFALIAMSLLMGNSPMGDVIGVVAGHCFYFVAEVLPLKYGRQFLQTPQWLIAAVDWVNGTHTVHVAPGGGGQRIVPPARNQGGFAGYNWGQGRRLGDD
ncbi:hypothetical protein BASA81_005431 [Batrachochytrium salamandrivorans]|nr:hypothetical protein BASA81_005431 [Batrachochytrium salamandrivorans]